MEEQVRKLKLLVDAHVCDGKYQGTRTFIEGIYKSINASDYNIELYLVAFDIENLKRTFGEVHGVHFIKLNSTNKYFRLAFEIPRIIKKLDIDYAHFNYTIPLFLSKKCKYIVTIHDVLFLDFPQFFPLSYRIKNKLLFRSSAKRADIITSVSNYSVQRIKYHFQLNKTIHVTKNGLNEEFLKSVDKTKSREFIFEKFGIEKFVLYVSRIEPRKNQDFILELYSELQLEKEQIKLVFIGTADVNSKEIMDEITSLNDLTGGKIIHLESISWHDLKHFYNAAHMAVFPSECEGFGIPPLESSALCTYTICANSTAMSDFDFLGTNLISLRDKNEWRKCLTKIRDDDFEKKHEAELMSNSDYVRENYQWSQTSSQLIKIIRDHEIGC